jgi:DNA polymerase III epsilon subunit family exonuclease
MNEVIPLIRNENGTLLFDNYGALKKWLTDGAQAYMSKDYESVEDALNDRHELETVRDKLKEVREEINRPFADVNEKLDELLKIVQEPLSRINKYKREYDRTEKAGRIKEYTKEKAESLGDYSEKVIGSDAFLEEDWLTTKFSEKKWKEAVDDKIAKVTQDINTINNTGGEHKAALLARYYETLSLDNIKQYLENLKAGSSGNLDELRDKDNTVGYKILKIFGTNRQMGQVIDEIDLLGLEYEELEDGMPKDFEEITEPYMDSFVAFDIETSGSSGAAYNDVPSEITEIGAVKVIDGEIVGAFDELCNPGRPITRRVEELTHITNEMVRDKPSVNEVIRQFKEYCGDLPLVGHNIKSMDLHYISAAAKRNGIEFSNQYFDTYLYAKKFKEEMGWDNVKLEYLAGQFGIQDDSHHRAYNDAEVNAAVYFKLKELGRQI